MQNNPDVNSLTIGEEPESHPENVGNADDQGRSDVEGQARHAERGSEESSAEVAAEDDEED